MNEKKLNSWFLFQVKMGFEKQTGSAYGRIYKHGLTYGGSLSVFSFMSLIYNLKELENVANFLPQKPRREADDGLASTFFVFSEFSTCSVFSKG